eukprot:893596-Pelagomonas_calceolata.AAC.1
MGHPSAPTPSSPRSRSSSTRAEHGRSWEERTSSKRRPRQLSSSTQGSAGKAKRHEATWGPPRRYGTSGGYVGPPKYGNGPPRFLGSA